MDLSESAKTATGAMSSITMATSVSVSEPTRKQRTHAITFTLNNYTNDDIQKVMLWIQDQCDYGCFSQEVSETGTPHLQGYMHFANARSYPPTAFRKLLERRAHDEVARGSPMQNHDYCAGLCEKKGNTLNPTFWEFGDVPAQGSRTDWSQALAQVQQVGVYAALEAQPHLIPNVRALERVRQLSHASQMRKMNVIVLYGSTGTGKTLAAWSAYPDLYSKPDGTWWDGYDGQEVVLLDDYDGHIPLPTLLKWLDRYSLQLPIKGGFTAARYTTVIITCNRHPEHWYPSAHPEHVRALMRRLRVILEKESFSIQDITNANQEDVS